MNWLESTRKLTRLKVMLLLPISRKIFYYPLEFFSRLSWKWVRGATRNFNLIFDMNHGCRGEHFQLGYKKRFPTFYDLNHHLFELQKIQSALKHQ